MLLIFSSFTIFRNWLHSIQLRYDFFLTNLMQKHINQQIKNNIQRIYRQILWPFNFILARLSKNFKFEQKKTATEKKHWVKTANETTSKPPGYCLRKCDYWLVSKSCSMCYVKLIAFKCYHLGNRMSVIDEVRETNTYCTHWKFVKAEKKYSVVYLLESLVLLFVVRNLYELQCV